MQSPDVAQTFREEPLGRCVHVCICVNPPQLLFLVHLLRFMAVSFPATEWTSAFEIPAVQQIMARMEKQVLQPKTGDSDSTITRLKRPLPFQSLDTSIFIYWQFTQTPSASHINMLALASTGVYWSGLQGSRGQSGVMKSNWPNDSICCWSLEIAEGFHYEVIWWGRCKRGDIKVSAELFQRE